MPEPLTDELKAARREKEKEKKRRQRGAAQGAKESAQAAQAEAAAAAAREQAAAAEAAARAAAGDRCDHCAGALPKSGALCRLVPVRRPPLPQLSRNLRNRALRYCARPPRVLAHNRARMAEAATRRLGGGS